jgi:hypothetical protein
MKNAAAYIKANKVSIIKRTLIIAGTVAAITLVGYVATRSEDDSIMLTENPDGSFTVSEA